MGLSADEVSSAMSFKTTTITRTKTKTTPTLPLSVCAVSAHRGSDCSRERVHEMHLHGERRVRNAACTNYCMSAPQV